MLTLTISSLLSLLQASGTAQLSHYRFVVDGKPVEAEISTMHGATRAPAPGDLAWVGGRRFVLDEQRENRLVHEGERLWRVFADGRRELLALELTGSKEDRALTDDNRRTLRGLQIERWDELAAGKLSLLRPDCYVEFGVSVNFKELPKLPDGLQYLELKWTEVADLSPLLKLAGLRYLSVPRRLELCTLGIVPKLRQLRYLELTGSGITDLTPLAGHPQLRWIEATSAPIKKLPHEQLPKLDCLIAYATGCPEPEVARFRKANPRTRVVVTFRQPLVDAVQRAVRLRIRTGSTCHRAADERVLFETDDPATRAELVGLLQFRERYSKPYVIPGCGQLTFEFLDASGKLILDVGMIGRYSLRSGAIWTKPASLEKAAAQDLAKWLEARGITAHR